ncbi:MAG: T9SS type A sorting domain-containing protein [Saprospiraceae bacterium]|nr:T9SS type A sorting domain-containing protein [Saprospiraceae bacterium]
MGIKQLLFTFFLCISSSSVILSQAYPDRHSTTLSEAWLSCQTAVSPNPARGSGHWIKYDLGDTYALQTSKFWNFNTPARVNSYNNEPWSNSPLQGKLEDGMKDVLIDISINGTTWVEWGRFNIPKAPGSSFYEGVFGPDFSGKIARYILITAVSNHGGTCYGLSEIKIKGTPATVSAVADPLLDASMAASPNPLVDNTLLTLTNFPKGIVKLRLVDINGKEVFAKNININTDVTEVPLSSSGMISGLYFLHASINGASKSIKLEVFK